nr:hypothetical protein [Tanacetum cinerariifolium]
MVAYLNKSDASEGFNQVIDFLNGSYIKLQALVDRKKVLITEAAIRDVLRLDDAGGVDCLPNEEIFAELARICYEKPSAMAAAVICLSTCQKFNFSKYIFESLVRNVDSSSKFYMYPRVRKRCSGVETPLFEGMLLAGEPEEQGDADEQVQGNDNDVAQGADTVVSGDDEALDACAALTRRVEHLEHDKVAQDLEITKLKTRVKKLERANKVKALKLRRLKKGRMIDKLDRDTGVALMVDEETEKKLKMLRLLKDNPEVQEAVEVVTTAKLITEVVVAVSESVTAASATTAAVPAATITAAPVRSKDKGKGILVKEPKPMKKKQQVEMDEEYVRKLYEELNQDIDWDVAIDHVKQKAKEDPYVQRYQNVAGFKLDYFKGMSYNDIRLIFEAKFNSNIEFLLKSKEQIVEEENRAIESINETPAQKAAKRRNLNEEVEDLKHHLEIVPDEDDDVYTEATLLARKVPVVDYQIIQLNNKPRYKIIRVDGTHQLAMFERPDGQDQVWKSQRSVHGQAKVKSWKLLESYGVHIISFTTTQLILLVERRYPLSRFTLDQMLNAVRLRVEEQSEMSLELLRFTRQQLQEGHHE